MNRICVSAPAKINLNLRVLGRRPDGYHELQTVFQSIDLCDRLTAEPAPPGVLTLEVEPEGSAPVDETNTVLRAARAVARFGGPDGGAKLKLKKKIPVGSGLGGGSADAAAALVLLDRLWRLDLDLLQLHRLAVDLGSDVPFFLCGGRALGLGRGDEISPLPDLPEMVVVAAVPALSISTAEVYNRLDSRLTWDRQEATVYAFAAELRERPEWRLLKNDLQETVIRGWPEVGEVLRMLKASRPLHAAVSGSGAAGFAIFEDFETARVAAAALPEDWWKHVGATTTRRQARLSVGAGE